MARTIEFSIEQGDITSFDADVLALKYALSFHGADQLVASRLIAAGIAEDALKPPFGEYRYLSSKGAVRAGHALLVGVGRLQSFGYQQIQQFAADVLRTLASEAPTTRSLAMTIHGPGYGLDEIEAATSQFAGYLDAITAGKLPGALEQIVIVERNADRVQRLRAAFDDYLPTLKGVTRLPKAWAYGIAVPSGSPSRESGEVVKPKPHIFIAMPFKPEFDDTFYFGIQQPVRRAGFTCERVDQSAFVGEILDVIKEKIATAALVIAELSEPNTNVYLEVGYAWGKGRPTLLLARDAGCLSFDVQGQKCVIYGSIRELEGALAKELENLQASGIIAV
jgi:hypothetical protein